jgi:fluoroacetyl-CoA thioesterase
LKPSLTPGLSFSKRILIDEERCISFMGRENMVYATPRMVSDVEYACRDYLLAHLDEGEDSVGAHVSIDHLGATPPGVEITIEARITAVDKRRVTFDYSVRDPLEEVGRGSHVRFVVDTAKSRERISAKRARLDSQIK